MIVYIRITDNWLPLPDSVLNELGWKDDDTLEAEVVEGGLIVSPKRVDSQNTQQTHTREMQSSPANYSRQAHSQS